MQTAAELKATFDANGYVVVPDLLTPAELREMRQAVDQLLDGSMKPQSPNLRDTMDDFDIQWEPAIRDDATIARRDKVRVAFHLCHTHSFFWQHATRPRLLEVVTALLGPDVNLYTDQMFMKPAHHGSEVPLHQDSGYWPNAEPRLLTCWTAIDDATIANGCVHVLPGTHKSPIEHKAFDHPTQPWGLTEDQVDLSTEVPVEIPAGGAMFHHSLLVHRSFPNTSDKARRGHATIYLPADLRFIGEWAFKFGFKPVARGGKPVGPASR